MNDPTARFRIRHATLGSILPAVAGPALGGFAGRAVGLKYPAIGADLGALVGGISGGVGGQLARETIEHQGPPPGAPYAIDSTINDIPPWALQGANILAPLLKQSGAMDWVLGEVPGGNVAQAAAAAPAGQRLQHAGRAFAGVAGGGVPGALLGLGAGKAIEALTGPVNVPLANMPLHELLAGLGGTIGATKGFRHMVPEGA